GALQKTDDLFLVYGNLLTQGGSQSAARRVHAQALAGDREADIEATKLLEECGGAYNSISSRSWTRGSIAASVELSADSKRLASVATVGACRKVLRSKFICRVSRILAAAWAASKEW